MLRLSGSTDILAVIVKCMQEVRRHFKLAGEDVSRELGITKAVSSDILQIPFSTSFIYRILYKILSSISYFSPTTFSKSRYLYIKPYIRNVFCSKFLYVRIYHTSNAMDIFYFYLIQCLKRKEKNREEERESLYIEETCSVLYFRGSFRERCWSNRERNLPLYIEYRTLYSSPLETV
jgi:hypothetical protein